MSKGVGVDAEQARKISDAGSEFKIPSAPRDELRQLSREEWMARYGGELASEQHFEQKDPNWADNPNSWWHKEVGRAGSEPPLWMREQWHLPDLDCPPGRDRHTAPLDERAERPLWAERMNLSGSTQGGQSNTIYGHRQEYLPTQKTAARSMYERYQPAYQRIANEEIPDVADPPDGRFWKAGVAQGVTVNPYEKRLSISARRKPIVVGPRSISVVVDGESHTLANVVRDVAWVHPHVQFTGYSMEHPVYRHVNMRVQTSQSSGIGGEQALAETLETTQKLFACVGEAMEAAMEEWPARKAAAEAQQRAAAEERQRLDAVREAAMARWVAMQEGSEPWEAALEIELFGKVISDRTGEQSA